MDISGTLASVLWKDSPEPAGNAKARLLEPPHDSLKDFATKLVRDERNAREAALAEMRKMLDWRFVHFAEEFRQQLSSLGDAGPCCSKEQLPPPASRAEMEQRLVEKQTRTAPEERSDGLLDERRLHLLEGKFALAENRLAEVQRWTKGLEEHFGDEQSRLAEAEAWLAHLDRRVSDAEYQLGGRRGAMASRLATVERLTIDGRSREAALHTEPPEHSGVPARSGGGSSGSGYSGGAATSILRGGSTDMQLGGLCGKDRTSGCSPSTKVSTNYATPSSQQSLTPSSPATLRHHGSR